MNRRDMIRNIAAGTVTVFIVPPLLSSCEKDDPDPDDNNGDNPDEDTLTIDLTEPDYSNLASAGGSIVIDNILIANTGDGFIAVSSVCTHQGCQVSYSHDNGNLPCPCHGSVFSTAGAVLAGPASTPLKKYNVAQEGDILTIEL
jgi:cytochrome b6-f complex iron-sulfur subunit